MVALGRKSFLTIVSRFTSSGLSLIALIIMFQELGASVYGTISLTMSLIITFNALADLGFINAHVKRVSEGKDINDCVSTYIVIKLILIGIMVAIVLGFILLYMGLYGKVFVDTTPDLIVMFLIAFIFNDISNIATATFDSRLETAKSQIVALVEPFVRVPLIVALAFAHASVSTLIFVYVLSAGVACLASLFFLSRERIAWHRPTLFKSYALFAFPVALITILNAVSMNIDKLLLGLFWSSREVGYYNGSLSMVNLFIVIGSSVTALTFPTFSRLHSEGKLREIRAITKKAERYISMIIFPIVTVIVLFPSDVANIMLGPGSSAAAGSFQFLSMALLINSLGMLYSIQLIAKNRPDLSAKLTLAFLSVEVVSLIVLLPKSLLGIPMLGLGATGAAIANLISTSVVFVIARYLAYQLTGSGTNPRILIHVVAAILTGLCLLALNILTPLQRWYHLVEFGLASLLLFSTFLYLAKELKRDDIRFLWGVINPIELGKYVWSELRPRGSK